jgi:hypothetical protein
VIGGRGIGDELGPAGKRSVAVDLETGGQCRGIAGGDAACHVVAGVCRRRGVQRRHGQRAAEVAGGGRRPADLLEHDRSLDEGCAGTARFVGDLEAGPARIDELPPVDGRPVQHVTRDRAQLGVEFVEFGHDATGSLGMPSPRSAMMVR